MIVPENSKAFFKKFFERSPASRAFLLVGEKEINSELEKILLFEVRLQSSLDRHLYEGEALTMDEARDIHEKAHQTSWSGSKVFLIKTDSISFDTQSVLLKTLEEPTPETYFIISAKSEGGFLAPLLSRLVILKPSRPTPYALRPSPKSFKKRMDEAVVAAKERGSSEKFLDTLEIWAHNELKGESTNYAELGEFIEDFLQTKARFFEKTYFNRMLLEHIMISRAYLEK